jgi:hypothetical protein
MAIILAPTSPSWRRELYAMAKVVGIVALELNPGFTDEQVRELATDTIREFRVPSTHRQR